jgi:hypothetical protein
VQRGPAHGTSARISPASRPLAASRSRGYDRRDERRLRTARAVSDPSPAALALATLVIALGAALQGSVGFGLALVSAPLLVLIEPALVPGPAIAASIALTVLTLLRERSALDLGGIGWAVAGRVPGIAAGAVALAVLPARTLGVLFGALVLLAVAITASGVALRPTRGTLLAAGVLSGFMGVTTAIGGPPVALVYLDGPGPRARATLSGYFIVGASMSLVGLAAVGRFGRRELLWAAALVPGIVAGYLASGRARGWIDAGRGRKAALITSAAGAVGVIVKSWLG